MPIMTQGAMVSSSMLETRCSTETKPGSGGRRTSLSLDVAVIKALSDVIYPIEEERRKPGKH